VLCAEIEMAGYETIMAYSKILTSLSPAETGENHMNYQ
jgi:hypothetical protein